MSIAITMPALSPTMEEGTLANWLVAEGDKVSSGDIIAEIETDKATMDLEAVDEGIIATIEVSEGTENVAVGTIIARLATNAEDPGLKSEQDIAAPVPPAPKPVSPAPDPQETSALEAPPVRLAVPSLPPAVADPRQEDVFASPLAKRIATYEGIDLSGLVGSGPKGRIVKADVIGTPARASIGKIAQPASAPASAAKQVENVHIDTPHEAHQINNVRKIIARRLTEAKQTIPHIYLTVDVRLDALLKLRRELNALLEIDDVKLTVNDLLIKAHARALKRVPSCNVSFQGDKLLRFMREDISVAVAAPTGLITPIIRDAGNKSLAQISREMKELASKARDGKLKPKEFQGGTASLSNLGMFGIKQFEAVINPPQAMIMAVGAGEQRPLAIDEALQAETMMNATGSFDHRAVDGADGAQLMRAFRELVENPLGLLA